jgi:hypothetical protein
LIALVNNHEIQTESVRERQQRDRTAKSTKPINDQRYSRADAANTNANAAATSTNSTATAKETIASGNGTITHTATATRRERSRSPNSRTTSALDDNLATTPIRAKPPIIAPISTSSTTNLTSPARQAQQQSIIGGVALPYMLTTIQDRTLLE